MVCKATRPFQLAFGLFDQGGPEILHAVGRHLVLAGSWLGALQLWIDESDTFASSCLVKTASLMQTVMTVMLRGRGRGLFSCFSELSLVELGSFV
jgi:hypothetical protein